MMAFPGRFLAAALLAGSVAGVASAPATAAPSGKGSAHGMGDLGSSREPIAIDADRLDVYDREGRAVFAGNVIAVQGETKMRCSVMNVFYEPKRGAKGATDAAGTTDKPPATAASPTPASAASPASVGSGLTNDSAIKKIECKGPVTITTKTQTATGDRAEFDRVINKVFLIGNAALTDGPNVTRGERVAYDVSTGVANIEGGRVKALIVPSSSQKDKDAKPKR